MSRRHEIAKLLSDGRVHSGPELAARLGITRAAVCKAVKRLRETGLDVHAVSGLGYRLPWAFTPLDPGRIRTHLDPDAVDAPIVVVEEVDSTSRFVLAQAGAGLPDGYTCLAETQPCGRGRRGRHWVASPFRNLMVSTAWRFDAGPGTVSGLSLAAGVAVIRALEDCGVNNLGLKWPNDVVLQERKLAGLLVDVRGEAEGPCTVVVGVGINIHITPPDQARIDQPWVDIVTATGAPVDRNRLAARLISQLLAMFGRFAREGFDGFREDWEALHIYAGRRVCVQTSNGPVWGRAVGASAAGALCVVDETGRRHQFLSADVSVRAVS